MREINTVEELDALPELTIVGLKGNEIERYAAQKDKLWFTPAEYDGVKSADLPDWVFPVLVLWEPAHEHNAPQGVGPDLGCSPS